MSAKLPVPPVRLPTPSGSLIRHTWPLPWLSTTVHPAGIVEPLNGSLRTGVPKLNWYPGAVHDG